MEIGINYGGHTSQPADDISRDGDLDYVVNLYNENDALQTFLDPFYVGSLDADLKVIYVHSNSIYRHLIVFKESTNEIGWLDFIDEGNEEFQGKDIRPFITLDSGKINKVVGIGNTIVILTPTATHYALWRSDDVGYTYLGDHLPEVDLQFGLKYGFVRLKKNNFSIRRNEETTVEYEERITNAILGDVNSAIAESEETGCFINNFYVRYALRLYDGSVVMHSAPILMVVNSSNEGPIVIESLRDQPLNTRVFHTYVTQSTLWYSSLVDTSILNKWKDVVTSIDVFVSPCISNYNASGKIDTVNGDKLILLEGERDDIQTSYGYSIPLLRDESYIVGQRNSVDNLDKFNSPSKDYYRDIILSGVLFNDCIGTASAGNRYIQTIELPKFSSEYLDAKYNTPQFYFFKTIKLSELSSEAKPLYAVDGQLSTLEQPDRLMPDDYLSHDKLVANNAYVYNSRLNLTNISRSCFGGFEPLSAMPACVYNPDYTTKPIYHIYVYIRENGQEVIVKQSAELWYLSPYFFYPNPNAYKAVLSVTKVPTTGGQIKTNYYELPLSQHDFLNGAYYRGRFLAEASLDASGNYISPKFFPDYLTPLEDFTPPTEDELQTKWIEYPNKIYTSEVNNPFLFKAEGVNTINTAEILALTSTTKALSQGQFGQFPMYAFTTDGIWALETSSTGGVASLHPVTRDICTNIDSITQIDNAVLFHSARGIMLLQGSETICISDSIDSPTLFDVGKLPQFFHVPKEFLLFILPRVPFKKFIKNSGMLYDYAHQRIILYQKSDGNLISEVSYVYSLKSKTWSMMQTDIKYTINAYPDAVVIAKNNDIFNYSRESSIHKTLAHQMLVTRPLKLDAPFNLKTINTLIQRGNFAKGKVRTILYGSRDLINWHLVASSVDHTLRNFRGTPYKHFRIVALTDLDAGESLTGASILFDVRQNNQLR